MEAFRLNPKKRPRALKALLKHCDALLKAKNSKANRTKVFWAERELATHISLRLEAQAQKGFLATVRSIIAQNWPVVWDTDKELELEALLRMQKRLLVRVLEDKDPWGDFKSSRETLNRKPHSGRFTRAYTNSLACLVKQVFRKKELRTFTQCWEHFRKRHEIGKPPQIPKGSDGVNLTACDAARELALILVDKPFLPAMTPESIAKAQANARFSMRIFGLSKEHLEAVYMNLDPPQFLQRIRRG